MPTMNGNASQAMPNSNGADAAQPPASTPQEASPGHTSRSADDGMRGFELGQVTGSNVNGQAFAEPASLYSSRGTQVRLSNGHSSVDDQHAHRLESLSRQSSGVCPAEAQPSCLTASGQHCAAMWSAACDQHFPQVESAKQDTPHHAQP